MHPRCTKISHKNTMVFWICCLLLWWAKLPHYWVCEHGHYLVSLWINLAFFLMILLVGPGIHSQSLLPTTKTNKQKKNIQICSWKTRFRVYKAMINSGSTDKMFFCTPCKHNLNDPHDKILLKNKVIYTQKCEEQVGWISSFALQPNDFWVNQLECACMCTQGFTAS